MENPKWHAGRPDCSHLENLLRDKEEQLKAMIEAFDGQIYICSPDYRIEYMNQQHIERTGFDATGQICFKALHNRNSVCPWCLNDRIFNGETVRCEVKSHKNRWYNVVSTPIYHSGGHISKQAMIIDITDRKRAELSLKTKVEEQTLLLDNIKTQSWFLTDPKTFGSVNQALADFLGYAKADIEQKTLYDFYDRAYAAEAEAENREVFESGKQVRTERWVTKRDGEKRLLTITKTPKLDSNGHVAYIICAGEDITDLRMAVASLEQSKKRLDLAMEATSNALWDWDLVTQRTYFSPRFYTMLDYDPYEMPQRFRAWYALIHPKDRVTIKEKLKDYLSGHIGAFEWEYRMKTKSGLWRWIMARGKIVERNQRGRALRIVGTHVDITERKLNEEALRLSEARLKQENVRLRSSFKGDHYFGKIIGKSNKMQRVYELILKAAASNANVIIYGESGTGKELVAQTIHDLSDRGSRRFIPVNCGAIPDNLMESEFFGYKKGAFTGATLDKPGYLDMANGSTLFMDEVAELDMNMQVKLLRAIDDGGYTPIGSREVKLPDVRIIAATNRDLESWLASGKICEDFYYRIHVIPIYLPPLRERKEDIPLLIYHYLQGHKEDGNIPSIPDRILQSMYRHNWPGNVRELQNTIHRYVTLEEIEFMDPSLTAPKKSRVPESGTVSVNDPLPLRKALNLYEKEYIQKRLYDLKWHRGEAARALGINRKTLYKKLTAHGLSKPQNRAH